MVERLGPCLRLTFAVAQADTCDGRPTRVIVAKLVIPAEAVPAMLADLAAGAAAETPPRRPGQTVNSTESRDTVTREPRSGGAFCLDNACRQ
jgi:hypothetical protein